MALHCALTCAEGCAENTSAQMLLKMHYASPYFFPFHLLNFEGFFSESVSEYVNLMKQELSFAFVFIKHKHKEHLVSDKDTVAKLIKNRDRKPKCRERSSETRLRSSEV